MIEKLVSVKRVEVFEDIHEAVVELESQAVSNNIQASRSTLLILESTGFREASPPARTYHFQREYSYTH